MRDLEERFPEEFVVVGVHSAKFPSERLTGNIREAILQHDIRHPVVNDAGFEVWNRYAVRAWPTVVLIDPEGKIVGQQSGEIDAAEFAPVIEAIIAEFEKEGKIDRRPLGLRPEMPGEPSRPLSYPAKLLGTPDGRLFVSDTGHHQILELQLADDGRSARLVRRLGTGEPGLTDGAASEAEFNAPHGLALDGNTLYVADTDNHAIRAIDLQDGRASTVAGTGAKGRGLARTGTKPTEIALRSPWDVLALEGVLLIAMAGSHQIWALTNQEQSPEGDIRLGVFAGNGREALVDGPPAKASFNQPSGLALGMGHLFVADPEASAIRAISLSEEPQVVTLVGQGLFEFGDVDGSGGDVRLQHPTGVAFSDDTVYIADSYNHKIKRLDPTTGRVETLIGTGESGRADGAFAQTRLFQPEGMTFVDLPDGRHLLAIADTNNHAIRVADLEKGQLVTLQLEDPSTVQREPAESMSSSQPQAAVRLNPIVVGSGAVTLAFKIELPAGYKINAEAPNGIRLVGDDEGNVQTFLPGENPTVTVTTDKDHDVTVELAIYYCEEKHPDLCKIHDAQVVLPLKVADGGPSKVRVPYRVE